MQFKDIVKVLRFRKMKTWKLNLKYKKADLLIYFSVVFGIPLSKVRPIWEEEMIQIHKSF